MTARISAINKKAGIFAPTKSTDAMASRITSLLPRLLALMFSVIAKSDAMKSSALAIVKPSVETPANYAMIIGNNEISRTVH